MKCTHFCQQSRGDATATGSAVRPVHHGVVDWIVFGLDEPVVDVAGRTGRFADREVAGEHATGKGTVPAREGGDFMPGRLGEGGEGEGEKESEEHFVLDC